MAVSHENLTGTESPRQAANVPSVREMVSQVQLDATLPPTPVRELLAASGASLFVLATDLAFVAAIRRAAGDDHPLFVVESWADLMEAVESGRCGIALLDAAMLGSRVAACVSTLAAYADRVVTLVAADRAMAHEYIGFLSDGRLHRLLIKPPAAGATRLLLESATARCLQLRDEYANDDAPERVAAKPRKFPKWAWAATAAVSAAALIGTAIAGGGLGWWDRSGAVETIPMSAATAMAPESVPTAAQRLSDYRAKAELAYREGRLAEPAADNALDHYLAILALAPADQAARAGVSSVVDTLFGRAEQALLANSLAEAAAALDHVRRADAASSRLAFLDAQLARGLAALAVAPPPAAAISASPPPAAAAPAELDSILSLATARLRRGQLLTPAGDSARAYLDRAAEIAGADPRVAAVRADLAAALISAARLLADADVTAATNLATEARRLGADSAALAAVERDVGAARAREQQERLGARLAAAQDRIRSGVLFAPSGESALDHLFRLQTDVPDLAGLAAAWEAFRQAATVSIESAIESQDWATAEAQLARLAQAPGGEEAVAPLVTELRAAQLQQTYLATATPASELPLLRSVPVVYPSQAQQRGLEGWVDLEFVVDRNGQPQNLVVVQGSPPGRFDAAALTAVEQYRYAPFERDGRVYERRLRLRVRFQM
jgi:TonB family protein